MAAFKAIELDASRHPTGRSELLEAANRQSAIAQLLDRIGATPDQASTDPTRTLVRLASGSTWTLVARSAPQPLTEPPSLRRGGAKHRTVH